MKRMLLVPCLVLSGCVSNSSDPIYPANWPTIETCTGAETCPDFTGVYRAVSEPVGPMVYPPGGRPQEMFVFIPIGASEPTPAVGRFDVECGVGAQTTLGFVLEPSPGQNLWEGLWSYPKG